jgi:hypothetical protein
MQICDRCHNSIVGKSFSGKRRDGSPATLCSDCVSQLKTKGQQQQPVKARSASTSANVDRKPKTSKSDSKWYTYIGQGGLFLAFAILVFIQLSRLESGEVYSVRLWWPVIILYRTLGFWGAITCPGIIAFLLFGWGIKKLLEDVDAD